jgi:hypothetical protein
MRVVFPGSLDFDAKIRDGTIASGADVDEKKHEIEAGSTNEEAVKEVRRVVMLRLGIKSEDIDRLMTKPSERR